MTVKAEEQFRNFLKIRGIQTRRRNGPVPKSRTAPDNGEARPVKPPPDHVRAMQSRAPWGGFPMQDDGAAKPGLSTEAETLLELTLELPRADRKAYFLALLAKGL